MTRADMLYMKLKEEKQTDTIFGKMKLNCPHQILDIPYCECEESCFACWMTEVEDGSK